jgi:hypothetical protein
MVSLRMYSHNISQTRFKSSVETSITDLKFCKIQSFMRIQVEIISKIRWRICAETRLSIIIYLYQVCHRVVLTHYRKDGLCRAPNALPGAFYRAHGKGHSLPCAYDTPHGSDKHTVQISLSCVVPQAHDKEQPLPCVGQERTAKRPRHVHRT